MNCHSVVDSPATTYPTARQTMLSATAVTMPKRSVILPATTAPRPKPNIVSVKASDTAPRVAANSACTTGSTTTTAHIPALPIEPSSTATARRIHARRESGTNGIESRLEGEVISTAAATSLAAAVRSSAMARYWACRCSATERIASCFSSFRGDATASNPESQGFSICNCTSEVRFARRNDRRKPR